MASTIITKNSSTASATPAVGDLQQGELAVNVTDKKIYTKDSSAAVVKLVGSLGNQEASAVAITGGSIAGITDLAVADGGTGSSTAAGARSNLSAAASGANSDITSLSGLTTALSVSQGGTGVTSSTGSGSVVLSNSPTLVTPALGTPSAAVLTNATGLPLSTGISGLGTGVATFLGTPSSANLLAAVTDETGTGALVFANSPTLVTPALGTPASATLTNATGLPISTGVSGLGTGIATALAVNTGSAGAPVLFNGALGTPSSGTVTNLTGTASININGTVGATTASTGAFTTLAASSSVTLSGGTANGVTYLNGSKVLTSGSALTFDGSKLEVSSSGEQIKLTSSGDFSSTGTGYLRFYDSVGAKGYVGYGGTASRFDINTGSSMNLNMNAVGGTMTFQISNSEQMRLTSTGLGIGTSSPAYKLDVSGSAPFRVNTTANNQMILSVSGTAYSQIAANSSSALVVMDGGATGTLLNLTQAGNLGLGVTPSAWNSGFKAIQVGARGAFWSSTGSSSTFVSNNTLYDSGGFKYVQTGAATTYEQGTGAHVWYTAASGTAGNAISFTQAMTLDANSNLNIGGTAIGYRLGLTVNSANGDGIQTINSNNAAYFTLHVNGATGSGVTGWANSTVLESVPASTGGLVLGSYSGSILFQTGARNTRATIDSSGNLLVGDTTSGTVRLRVTNSASDDIALFKNSNATPYGVNVSFSGASPNNTTSYFYTCADSGPTTRFKVYSNGGIANYSANNVNLSDQRVKTDIQDAGGYLAKICAIPVRTFKYKDQTDDLSNLGVIAQEVEAVAPELVDTTGFGEMPEDGVPLKAIYQTDLQYALMKALQELKAEFDAYKASHP